MKTRAFPRLTPAVGLLATALLFGGLISPAWCQTNTQPNEALDPATIGPKFDLQVSGGRIFETPGKNDGPTATVGTLVDLLQKKKLDFNVIMGQGVAGVPLSDFKLREVTLATVMAIIPSITSDRVIIRAQTGAGRRGGGGSGGTGGGGGFQGGGPPAGLVIPGNVYQLELSQQGFGGRGGFGGGFGAGVSDNRPQRYVEVFNVNNYIAELNRRGKKDKAAIGSELQEVEHMIDVTLTKMRVGPPAKDEQLDVEFHEGSGLLIVIGPQDAISVATKIINALPGQKNNATGETSASLSALSDPAYLNLSQREREYYDAHPDELKAYLQTQRGQSAAPPNAKPGAADGQ